MLIPETNTRVLIDAALLYNLSSSTPKNFYFSEYSIPILRKCLSIWPLDLSSLHILQNFLPFKSSYTVSLPFRAGGIWLYLFYEAVGPVTIHPFNRRGWWTGVVYLFSVLRLKSVQEQSKSVRRFHSKSENIKSGCNTTVVFLFSVGWLYYLMWMIVNDS